MMSWRQVPYSTRMLKIAEYDDEVFVRTIAVIEHPNQLSNEQKADARLIAAAPDLLNACLAFVGAYEKVIATRKNRCGLADGTAGHRAGNLIQRKDNNYVAIY